MYFYLNKAPPSLMPTIWLYYLSRPKWWREWGPATCMTSNGRSMSLPSNPQRPAQLYQLENQHDPTGWPSSNPSKPAVMINGDRNSYIQRTQTSISQKTTIISVRYEALLTWHRWITGDQNSQHIDGEIARRLCFMMLSFVYTSPGNWLHGSSQPRTTGTGLFLIE